MGFGPELCGLVAWCEAVRGPEIRDFLTQRHEDSKDGILEYGPELCAVVAWCEAVRGHKSRNHLTRRRGVTEGELGFGPELCGLVAWCEVDRGPEIRDFLTQRHEDSKDMDLGPWPGTLCRCALV